jgi:transposase-like protein
MKHKRNSTKKRIVKQYLNGTSVNSLAQDNSIPVSTIYSWIKHYGPLRAKYVPRHSEKQYAILKVEYDKLRYMYEIRKEFDNYHLQIFDLEQVGCLQKIAHRSEEPEYHMEYLLPSDDPITEKLYIIDDGDHSTMLLASEY